MKYVFLLFLSFLLIIETAYSQNISQSDATKLIREDDPVFKKQKQQWLEDMHRCEPGINWRAIEYETRMSKYNLKQKYVREQLAKGIDYETLAQTVDIGTTGFRGFWSEKGSNNQAGRVHTCDIDWGEKPFPGHIYAASAGGNIWRGNLNGTGWVCLNNSFKIRDIRFVKAIPTNGLKRNVRVVVVGNYPPMVHFTVNDGISWQQATGLDDLLLGYIKRAIVKNSTGEIYLLCDRWNGSINVTEIYVSSDNGTSFSSIGTLDASLSYCDIWTPKYEMDDIYVIHREKLSRILNNQIKSVKNPEIILNQNWGNIANVLLNGSVSKNSIVLTALFNDSQIDTAYIYYYAPLAGWQQTGAAPNRTFELNSFSASTKNSDDVFVGDVECWRSSDKGKNWTRVNKWDSYYGNPETKLHADIPGIIPVLNSDGDEIVYVTTDGGLYKSEDGLKTVENLSLSGLNVSQYYSTLSAQSGNKELYAGSQDQGFQRCLEDSNTALSFQQTISGDYGHLASGDGTTHLWSVYPGFAMLYVNPSKSNIKSYYYSFENMKNWLWMPPLHVDKSNPESVYLISGQPTNQSIKASYIWKLTLVQDEIISERLPFNFVTHDDGDQVSAFDINASKIIFPKVNYYAMTSYGRIFRSDDKGDTWEEIDGFRGPSAHYFYGSTILSMPSILKTGKLYIAGSGYTNPGVYVSNDNGDSFTPLDSGLPRTLVYRMAATPDDDFLFAATEAGPYVYIAREKRWYSMDSPDSPDQVFWSVEYLDSLKTVRFATYGRGIWDFKITRTVSDDVNDVTENSTTVPNIKIKTSPNPFGDKINITIQSDANTQATVRIYDIQGRMVRQLGSGLLNIGDNVFEWNGNFVNGITTPSGTYMITVASNGITNYLKLIRN